MKRMKKLAGLLLAMVMVFSMALTAFAAEVTNGTSDSTKGSITISPAVAEQTYTIYRIFDLESFDSEIPAYAYKINDKWGAWAKTQTSYVKVDSQGYVTWVEGADVAKFAKNALEYAKNNKIAADGSGTVGKDETSIVLGRDKECNNTLTLGYYLVDSSLGALCSINTTQPDATIEEKNVEPTIEKLVQEDSDSKWSSKNHADIGQVVNYKTTIHAKKGAEKYILHDKMTDGLTFDSTSVVVKVGDKTLGGGKDYELVITGLPKDCFPSSDKDAEAETCDFHIVFTKEYLDTITEDTDIVVTYSATLNKYAVIADGTNDNDTRLTYGDDKKTEWSTTQTKTFKFDLIKTDGENKENSTIIYGAKFKLYDAMTGGNEIPVVKVEDGVYRKAVTGETGVEIEVGVATIQGLDANTNYYLEETVAPKGFNKLANRVEVELGEKNNTTTLSADNLRHVEGGVEVENQKGAILPTTGGMGTTIFYILGAILVIGAAVLLITRKRMSNEE